MVNFLKPESIGFVTVISLRFFSIIGLLRIDNQCRLRVRLLP